MRKGNLTKFFDKKTPEGLNVLDGSTKSAEDFEFSRGHQKLIISITNLVKQTLDENGLDGFAETSKSKAKKKKSANTWSDVPRKLRKNSSEVASEVSSNLQRPDVESNAVNIVINSNQEIFAHQSTLVKKALKSLQVLTPLMYKKVTPIFLASYTS